MSDAGSGVSRQYFEKLASLRFFAALLVMFSHLKLFAVTSSLFVRSIDRHIFWCGFIGVSVFYVLSGFVISYANENWLGWRRYLIGRVSRIYPPHLLVTAMVVLLFGSSLTGVTSPAIWILNLGLLHAWVPNKASFFSLNNVSWSLSVEMFFYIAFLFVRKLRNNSLYFLTATFFLVNFSSEWTMQHKSSEFTQWLFYINPISRFPEFLLGMSLFRLYRTGFEFRLIGRLDFLAVFFAMVATVSALHALSINSIFLYSTVPALFSFVMVAVLVSGRSSSYMQNRWLVLLGEASFALYLIHKSVFNLARAALRNLHIHHGVPWMLAAAAVAIALSVVFYLKAEILAMRSVRRYLMEKLA